MKLNSTSLFMMVLAIFVSSAACSKKSTSNSGRSIDVVPIDDGSGIDDDSRGDDDYAVDDDEVIDDDGVVVEANPNHILFTQYPDRIPRQKVCTNVLQGRNAETLRKFFNWDIQNLEGPVTICVEQKAGAARCPNGENYCDSLVQKDVRIRIEYEDDFKFWYYDSAKTADSVDEHGNRIDGSSNYAKLLSYTGGAGSNTVEIILMDGAGFLRLEGFKTSSGAYDLSFAFADRPSYTAARSYDISRGIENSTSPNFSTRRAATLSDMATCAKSANGTAKSSNGVDCAARFVFSYHFFANLNSEYTQTNITNIPLWIQNQVTIARQYVTNQLPSQFSQFTGYTGGTFGRLLINGL